MFESLATFTASLPEWLQWVGIIAISAIPFVESYFGSAIGVLVGISPVIAVVAAVIGNVVTMLLVVLGAHAARTKLTASSEPKEPSRRRARITRLFDRYGVAGVSLLGQAFLPSQITSGMMVSFGASKNAVIAWQVVSIILWGILFGTLAALGVNVLDPQG